MQVQWSTTHVSGNCWMSDASGLLIALLPTLLWTYTLDWSPRAEIKQSARVCNLLCEVGTQLRNKAERAVTREAKWGQTTISPMGGQQLQLHGKSFPTRFYQWWPKILPMMAPRAALMPRHADRVCQRRDRCSSATFQLLSNCTEKVKRPGPRPKLARAGHRWNKWAMANGLRAYSNF